MAYYIYRGVKGITHRGKGIENGDILDLEKEPSELGLPQGQFEKASVLKGLDASKKKLMKVNETLAMLDRMLRDADERLKSVKSAIADNEKEKKRMADFVENYIDVFGEKPSKTSGKKEVKADGDN